MDAFCAITYHQGRSVQGRSKESIVNEAESLTKRDDFKGYIHDVDVPQLISVVFLVKTAAIGYLC